MRRISFIILTLLIAFPSFADILRPISWTFGFNKKEVAVGDVIEIELNATIDKDWYLYSNDFDPDLGPNLTTAQFSGEGFTLVGALTPINPHRKFDDVWGGEVSIFKGTGKFIQKIKITSTNVNIKGTLDYQICTDIDGKCIPFEDDFELQLKAKTAPETKAEPQKPVEEPVKLTSTPVEISPISSSPIAIQEGKKEDGIINPVSWKVSMQPEQPKAGEKAIIRFEGKIIDNWYVYSSDFELDPGPVPATIIFEENETFIASAPLKPSGAKLKYDEIFEGEVSVMHDVAIFEQEVEILKNDFTINGTLDFQSCSEIDGKCIPASEDFSFSKNAGKSASPLESADSEKDKKGLLKQRDPNDAYSLLAFMVLAFLGGLAALLTPCVFPMIPMTVTFFTGKAKNRRDAIIKALFYGFSIVAIYTLVGVIFSRLNGPEFANWLSTHWGPNIFFFLVFFIFALSFLGLFEITLPNKFVNSVDQQADKGGYYGVFFMAFTLVLVSFSCTGPIVGSILVEAAGGQIVKPILGMFAFSMAFAIPFTLFAIFPEWLSSLPKSGGWLNSVKVVLGFLELALGLKFLSVADQVYHWEILDREVYLALWIVIFFLLGMYFLGKLRLPHDDKAEHTTVPRLLLAIATFSFVVYLIPGMFGAPLKALSGYLPPLTTHDFNLSAALNNQGALMNELDERCEPPKHADFLHFPHGIKGYFDYEQALSCAKATGKPIFIDFTGGSCVNCREMEARVWSDPEVLKRLKNDFIMLALYVDDKTELPESEWYTSTYDGKVKKTIGKQNADFQISRFENNAQPYYVILDENEELLAEPKAYDLNVQNFIEFLDTALEKHKK